MTTISLNRLNIGDDVIMKGKGKDRARRGKLLVMFYKSDGKLRGVVEDESGDLHVVNPLSQCKRVTGV